MIKLIIVDDHRMFRESISRILKSRKLFDIIGEAGSGVELLKILETRKPDVILVDISMPDMDGMEVTKIITEKYPDIKSIALSSFADSNFYYHMVESGAKGFVLKSASLSELEEAISEVARGRSWFSSEMLQKIILDMSKPKYEIRDILSDREIEILHLICKNHSNEEISQKLALSYDTVKWHRANILSKTGCHNGIGLLLFSLKNKLIEIPLT